MAGKLVGNAHGFGEAVFRWQPRAGAGGGGPSELALAYATTIHKAQGSECPAVVIPVTTQHYPMLQRNLLYTGVTRGRRLVVLVAQPKAVAIAVRGEQERRPWSKLKEWLAAQPTNSNRAFTARDPLGLL